jgi:HEAT repeat protein
MFKINPLKPFLLSLALVSSIDTTLHLHQHPLFAQEGDDRIQTVIYSYEKWTKDGDKRFVLVPKPVSIKKGELKDQFRELYQLLKEGKANTYGDVKFQAKDDIVYIFLDKSKSNLHPIVVAEATYTFTENGAKAVEFPDSSIINPQTRKDIRYPAFQLSFPFYSVLPPKQVTGVLVELPDGTFLTPSAFYDHLKQKDAKMVAQLIEGLKGGDPLVIEAILKAQESLQLQLSDGLLPLLNNGSEEVRLLAVKGLKGDDRAEINGALRDVMDKDPSAKVKDEAAAVLSMSKDVKFSEAASFHALRSQDPNVVKQAAKGLIQAKSKEAVPQLFATLSNQDAGVREAVIDALIAKKELKGLADQLTGALDVQAKKQVAIALMKLQQEAISFPALTFLMDNADPSSIKEVSTQLLSYQKNPKIVDVLSVGLKHKEVEVRKSTAKAMSQLDAKSAKSAIMALADQSWDDLESGRIIAESMQALHVKLGFAEVSKDFSSAKENVKLSAISALGKLFIDVKEKKNQAKVQILKPRHNLQELMVKCQMKQVAKHCLNYQRQLKLMCEKWWLTALNSMQKA